MRGYFDDGSNIANWSVWTALDTYLIIKEEWGWDPITQALTVYYTLPAAEVPTTGDEEFNAWVLHLSNATGYNLAPYHARGDSHLHRIHTIRLPISQSG